MNTPEELLPLVDWWKKDGKKYLVMLLVAALAAAGAYLWVNKERGLDAEATRFACGFGEFQLQELEDAVLKFGDRDVGGIIKLRLAEKYVEAEDFAKALEIYAAIANGKSVPPAFAFAPEYGVAYCQESLGNWADAQKGYEAIAAEANPDSPFVFDAKLGSARCYAFLEGVTNKTEKLEALKKAFEKDAFAKACIERTIDAVENWEKRERPVPPAVPLKLDADPAAGVVPPAAADAAPVSKKPAAEKVSSDVKPSSKAEKAPAAKKPAAAGKATAVPSKPAAGKAPAGKKPAPKPPKAK